VGDAHLVAGEAEATAAFTRFLDGAPDRFERLVLVGDIFDLWLARPHLHEEHHVLVLAAVARAVAAGLPVDYVVGNRDFGVESLPGHPFARVAVVTLGSLPPRTAADWVAEHGDLVNEDDRQYRAWRSLARSRPVLGSFLRLPGRVGVPASQWLERRMRTTNLAWKRRFPTEHARRHAASLFARTGARFLVLGHFHQELRIAADAGEVIVLPDWKRSRRHAEWLPSRRPGDAPTMEFAESLG
jgi:UDP-2,3-diacylglucosamine pyrophosphatase LpxH